MPKAKPTTLNTINKTTIRYYQAFYTFISRNQSLRPELHPPVRLVASDIHGSTEGAIESWAHQIEAEGSHPWSLNLFWISLSFSMEKMRGTKSPSNNADLVEIKVENGLHLSSSMAVIIVKSCKWIISAMRTITVTWEYWPSSIPTSQSLVWSSLKLSKVF